MCLYIMNFFNSMVCFCWKTHVPRFCINDDQDGIWAILTYQLINGNIILVEFGASVIPTYNLLLCCIDTQLVGDCLELK